MNWLQDAHDLTLNLLAEGVGVVVTIFVVDRWAKLREERRVEPLLASTLRDAQRIYGTGLDLIGHALSCASLTTDLPLLREQGLSASDPRLTAIYDRVRMSGEINVCHMNPSLPITYWRWGDYVVHVARNQKAAIDQFLERYNFIAPPKLAAAIHRLADTMMFHLPVQAPILFTGAQHSVPGMFTTAAQDLTTVGSAIDALAGKLKDDWRTEMRVREMFVMVASLVEASPSRTSDAPYRPAIA